jgi:AcrR family transcriptional regulator
MPRPSRRVDLALLAAGLELLPVHGCAGLSQRLLAEHAGVQPGMFHYHFESKDAFLRTLLQQLYDELFGRLGDSVAGDGPAVARLRQGLLAIARFARQHPALIGRLVADAVSGVAVVHEFLRDNAPRHVGLLLALLQQAEAEGAVAPRPPLQRLMFLLASSVLPVLAGSGVQALGLQPARAVGRQVLDDAAIAERIDLALLALRQPVEAST